MKKKTFISRTLKSGQVVSGTVYHIGSLCTKYQIWARREYGLSDLESLACFCVGDTDLWPHYFDSAEQVESIAKIGFEKSKGEIPDLSSI